MKPCTVLLRPSTLLSVLGLVLSSCAHYYHQPASSPAVTGSLAGVECAGETPTSLARKVGEVLDPDSEGMDARLDRVVDASHEVAPFRAYLRCLVEQGLDNHLRSDTEAPATESQGTYPP